MAVKRLEGKLDATGLKFGLVASRFNNFITDKMIEGALDCLVRHGAKQEEQEVAYVPGAMEIAPAARRMAESGRYAAVICLGAVIRGHTPHFDYVAGESAKGVARLGIDSKVPVIYGIITADTLEQAIERAGTKAGNKGWDAALAAAEMVNLYRALG